MEKQKYFCRNDKQVNLENTCVKKEAWLFIVFSISNAAKNTGSFMKQMLGSEHLPNIIS